MGSRKRWKDSASGLAPGEPSKPLKGNNQNGLWSVRKTPPRRMKTPSAGNGIGPDGSICICGSGGVRGLRKGEIEAYWSKALGGVDWMNRAEMAEAIPPAYSEFIGRQAIAHTANKQI